MKRILFFAIIIILVVGLAKVVGKALVRQKSRSQGGIKETFLTPTALEKNKSNKCPDGFILIPGDPLYHTPSFCAMKYDAKCALKSSPETGLAPAHHSSCSGEAGNDYYGTYKNDGLGCSCTGSREVVSTKSGFPIAYIPLDDGTKNDAKNYCASQGWHVLTNDEWMTIARNVEKVSVNWCDRNGANCGFAPGTPGKILANGHNDAGNEAGAGADSGSALIAGNDDQPCFGTTTDGSNTCGGKGSQKRTLTLDNGEVIWDLAGNVWQWVDAKIMRKDQPKSVALGLVDQGFLWSEFSKGGVLKSFITDNGQGGELGYDAFRPSNPDWNSKQGVGRIFHYSTAGNDTSTKEYGFIRGGNFRHGYDSGAFTIHLSPEVDKRGINDVGFRCAVSENN